MPSNREVLDDLFAAGAIRLQRSALFDTPPAPLPPGTDFDRVEGMLLGLAIGDALGAPTEGMTPTRRRQRCGEVRDYLPNRYVADGRGYPTDDTQLAFWLLEQLNARRGFVPEAVAERFAGGRIFGIGATVRAFLAAYHRGQPWHACGPESAGNGALMRIAPILIPHLRKPTTDLWVDTALAAMMTHNDFASTAICLAFVNLLWQLLAMDSAPDPAWWLDEYVRVASALEGETTYRSRSPAYPDYEGPVWRFVATEVEKARRSDEAVASACDRWYSAAFVMETIGAVLYILTRHGHDAEEAIVRAVNDTKDNDSVAAVVGAAVGALHGRAALPERWVANLSGRTTEDDDGRVFELIREARTIWWDVAGTDLR